ncbi:LPS translocon maturation chaperone LptM [Legionella lansingensis]|nr:lipoprotein [Legionella lansingensis]
MRGLLLLTIAVLTLSSCGQKGPLYLPDHTQPQKKSTTATK